MVIVPAAVAVNASVHAADWLPVGVSGQRPPDTKCPVGLLSVTSPLGAGATTPVGLRATTVQTACPCAVSTLGVQLTASVGVVNTIGPAGTVIVAVAGADVPPASVAWYVKLSVPL